MESISVAQAARRLSLSDVMVYRMIADGRLTGRGLPVRVDSDAVRSLALQRRSEALARRRGIVDLARMVDSLLHAPPGSTCLPPPGRAALRAVPADGFAIFGRDVLEAAAVRDRVDGCAFCLAHMTARVHGTFPPEDGQAYRLLLGEPCPKDRQRWAVQDAARRRAADRARLAEAARREQAEKQKARAAFQAAQAEASAAASRLRSATTAYATVDPTVVASATAQARERGAFRSSSKWPSWCDCDHTHQCAGHAASDARAARRSKPFRRQS